MVTSQETRQLLLRPREPCLTLVPTDIADHDDPANDEMRAGSRQLSRILHDKAHKVDVAVHFGITTRSCPAGQLPQQLEH